MALPTSKKTETEDLFDPKFLERLRAMFLRLRKRKKLRKKGLQSTPATGYTREFKDYRSYTPNDDYRSIDWRLYARLEKLFVRLYEEIQEFHIHIVIDTSASMVEPFKEKKLNAQRLAVALGYLGLISQHRVSLYSMSDQVVDSMPPLKGQGNIKRIIDYLSKLEFGGTTQLRQCFRNFKPSRRRYGIIFMLSDLYGQDLESAKEAMRHAVAWPGEIHMIQIVHPWERKPDLEGEIQLVDVETNEARKLWFTKRELKRYVETYENFLKTIERECVARQIDYMQWSTDGSFEDLFLTLLSRGSALAGNA
ncbi:MAG: hypothetical protein ACI8UO_000530 [Verrucomicrobiales bacterium]|jgi:uncharacterized protein (DUF58 family)